MAMQNTRINDAGVRKWAGYRWCVYEKVFSMLKNYVDEIIFILYIVLKLRLGILHM